jgi:hypothetical protein
MTIDFASKFPRTAGWDLAMRDCGSAFDSGLMEAPRVLAGNWIVDGKSV